jgi:pyruvate dehydrogenase complex dehydrogenase (E1) component
VAALHALARDGAVAMDAPSKAIQRYGIDAQAAAPWTR